METKSFEEWIDIPKESRRTYFFGDGFTYTVIEPRKLFVKESGSHRLVDSEGEMHYIRDDWRTFSADGEWSFTVK